MLKRRCQFAINASLITFLISSFLPIWSCLHFGLGCVIAESCIFWKLVIHLVAGFGSEGVWFWLIRDHGSNWILAFGMLASGFAVGFVLSFVVLWPTQFAS